MHRVAVLALDQVYPFELGIPARVFGIARTPAGEPAYEVLACTVDGGPVRTNGGFGVTVDHTAEVLATADTVVVPPFSPPHPVYQDGTLPGPVADALALVRPGTRLVSICAATYVLAAAGLLDGRPATTHWAFTESFGALFPRVRLDPKVLFVDDGDILTSAGAAAGIDLCLHILRHDLGSEEANRVARHCVVPPWRDGGQAQYIERPVPQSSIATTGPTRAWALDHLGRQLPLAELAAHASLSVRTFTRRFREEVGLSPNQWLTQQRIALARSLLETTDLPVDAIAHRCGFGTGTSLRQHFHTAVGVPPLAYRRTFQAKEPTAS
ncbi:helix-turn-helix domain-containing protein [Kitasatospora sp. NBC_00374]|uniref:GlxA family transcriptional regulator n=1 Tax=Kitasatospora sp. NBC_00374 TaxID=2975964 RepID=UPI0030DF8A35